MPFTFYRIHFRSYIRVYPVMRYWVSIYNLGRPSATIITNRGVVYNHWLQRERCTNKQPRVDAITWQRTCVQFFLFGRLAHIFTSQRRNSCRFPTFFVCQVTRFHLLRHKIKKEKKTHSLIYAEHFFYLLFQFMLSFDNKLPNEKVNSYYYCYYFTILGGATNQKGETKKNE